MKREMPKLSMQGRGASVAAGGVAALLILLWSLMLAPEPVRAEPYMAVRDGYKCSQCHVNKTGGGARTDYGTVYMQTRLAAGAAGDAESGGPHNDAAQGRVSPSVSFGADVRATLLNTKFDHATGTTQFNRPVACDTCHTDPKAGLNGAGEGGGGKIADVYLRLQAVPDVASIVYSVSAVPNATTRDFYGLVEQLPLDGYLKAGTFKLPNGLQNTWDYPFQHVVQGGYQGMLGFETVYATGVEYGIEPGPFTVALSVTNPDDLTKNPNDKRYFLTASAAGRFGLIGVNYAQDPRSPTATRTLTSGFIGTSLGRITVLGQVDQVTDTDTSVSPNLKNTQQAGLAEVDFLIKRGHNLKYVVEVRDPSLSHTNDTRDRQSVIYEPFLTPYLQARLGYRKYAGPTQTTNDTNNGDQWFLEGHFAF